MKGLIRHTVFNAISLFILSELLSGVKIVGGLKTLIVSGFLLSLLFKFLKPIFGIFSIPLNVVTLGLFSFFMNAILLYLLTVFVPDVSISQFTFNGYQFAGFIVPVMHFNGLYAYVISAGILSAIINFFDWICQK